MTRFATSRLSAVVLAALPLLASCSSMFTDQTIGTRGTPAGGAIFTTYSAIGTSIGAGIQSGGINDSTQREAYTYQFAVAQGHIPGVDWFYPSFAMPGCPAPLANATTGARVGGASAAACATRSSASIAPFENNTSIPSIRAAQVLDITNLAFPATDTLKLAQFIVGARNPIDMVVAEHPTFVTLEMGANDVLGAATHGDTTLLTSTASFSASMDAIATKLDSTHAKVAVANIPNVTVIPHFSKASVFFCLKTGACGFPAALPYSSPLFTVDASCAPNAAGGIGDNYLVPFTTTGNITAVLAASRAAKLDCQRDSALVGTAASPLVAVAPAGATINPLELAAITARVAAFNTTIAALATAHGYALVDFNAALTAQAANIPPFPNFATPTQLFGTLFSQDGIHPTKAGHKLIANAFITAANTLGGSLSPIP
ncbi:MAG TPA: hypothetical protein VGI92_13430 [Gemmatimonadales bacterium]|jgi:lysophospholipase L1-like esterase